MIRGVKLDQWFCWIFWIENTLIYFPVILIILAIVILYILFYPSDHDPHHHPLVCSSLPFIILIISFGGNIVHFVWRKIEPTVLPVEKITIIMYVLLIIIIIQSSSSSFTNAEDIRLAGGLWG